MRKQHELSIWRVSEKQVLVNIGSYMDYGGNPEKERDSQSQSTHFRGIRQLVDGMIWDHAAVGSSPATPILATPSSGTGDLRKTCGSATAKLSGY